MLCGCLGVHRKMCGVCLCTFLKLLKCGKCMREKLSWFCLKHTTKGGCNIDSSNIEACHCITKKNDRAIVKSSRRKDCQQVLSVKKNLKNLKMEDIGLTGDNKFLSIIVCVPTTVSCGRNQRFFSIWEKSIG